MKTITIKPAEEIVVRDPETQIEYLCVFNTKCVLLFQTAMQTEHITAKRITTDLLPLVIYSAVNTRGEITMDDARALADRMGTESGMMLVNTFLESLSDTLTDDQKKTIRGSLKKMITMIA